MNYRDSLKINSAGHLEIGGCDTADLVKRYSTPLYVMDVSYVKSVCRAFKDTINRYYGNGNCAYASKAFSCSAIYSIMKDEKMCIDVVSGGEIYTALNAGFDLKNAYFHGNNKSYEELQLAISNNIGTIVVDNEEEVELISNICKELNKSQKVLVRSNPGVEAHTHEYIQTSKVDSKFGFSIKNGDCLSVIKKILVTDNVEFEGLHCHIGSQIMDKNAFCLAVDVMTDYIKKLQIENKIEVNCLNMGGGFAVHYTDEDPLFSVDDYCEYVKSIVLALNKCIETKHIKKPYLVIEPGRSIVGEAGITLYSVGNIKNIKNIKKYVSVNGGMYDNIRPALYNAKYEAILANRANDVNEEVVTVAGKCCESGDIIIKDIYLPKVRKDDILAVFTTGAYCYSMASNYNRNVLPPVIFVEEGKSGYAVKKQTYEDIIRNDVVNVEYTK